MLSFKEKMIYQSTFDFLRGIEKNNNKEWVDEHRDSYQKAIENFTAFTQRLIDGISEFDSEIAKVNLDAKDCVPRLTRDQRFTDKGPYKNHFYCRIGVSGKKSKDVSYGAFIKPEGSFIYAGIYEPDNDRLKQIRSNIASNYTEWTKIISDKDLLKAFPDGIVSDHNLKRIPSDFEKGHEAETYLKMKDYIVRNEYADSYFIPNDHLNKIIEKFKTTQRLLDFLRKN
tara:strand:- start:190 stop:870 length:681 start_codon:yes stop_codon:yes gene_type:complete